MDIRTTAAYMALIAAFSFFPIGPPARALADYRPTEYPAAVQDVLAAYPFVAPRSDGSQSPVWIAELAGGGVHLVDAEGLVEVSPALDGDGNDWTCWYTGKEIRIFVYEARDPFSLIYLTVNSDGDEASGRAKQVDLAAWAMRYARPKWPDLLGWLATLPP